MAHVCPVGPKEAFTAFHVAVFNPFDEDIYPISLFWKHGVLRATTVIRSLDVARVVPISGSDFEYYFQISPVDPKVGDTLYITGYNQNKEMTTVTAKVKVLNIIAGTTLLYDKTPGPGSSGSCLFNEEGEVVGINHSYRTASNGRPYGIGTWLSPSVIEALRSKEE
jgi:hypothetical protein